MTQQVGRNIFSLGLSRVVSGIILFVVYIRLVNYLGPQDFGRFSLILAYYTIFLLLLDLGIQKYVTKKVSEDRAAGAAYLGNFMPLQLGLGLLVWGLFVLIPRLFGYDPVVSSGLALTGAGLLVLSLSLPLVAVVHAWQRLDLTALVNFLNTLLNAAWLALVIVLRQGVVFLVGFYLLMGIVDLVLYLVITKKMVWSGWKFNWGRWREMLTYGLPFALVAGFEVLIQKVDVVIQKVFLSFAEVGLYSAAYRFLDFLTFIPAVVALSLFPYLSEARDLKEAPVSAVLSRLNRYLLALAVPLGLGGTVLARPIVQTLFGEAYLPSAIPFQILIWASVLTFLYAVPNAVMLVKKPRAMVLILGLTAALNILANWLLIPRFGILASAWITVLSYVLVASSYIFFSRREASFRLFGYAFWPAVSAAVMAYVVWLLSSLNIYLLIGLGALVYLGILFAVRFLQKEDLVFLGSILRKQQKV